MTKLNRELPPWRGHFGLLLSPIPQLFPSLHQLLDGPRDGECLVVQAALPMSFAVKIFDVSRAQERQASL
jgi:hypothetical protein